MAEKELKAGDVVFHDGAHWKVLGLVEPVGGGSHAQLECLDRDAAKNVDAAKLDAIEADVDALVEGREVLMRVPRLRHREKIISRRIGEWTEKAEQLRTMRDEAQARHDAGDLQAVENRVLVPGRVIHLKPEDLIGMANDALDGLEHRIELATEELADTRKALKE